MSHDASADASVSSINSSTHYDDSEKESGVGDGNESCQLEMENNHADSEATTARLEPQSTKVYYYVDKEPDPYVTTVDVPPSQITLKHFKARLAKTTYKYFNHNIVDGITEKTEIKDDNEILKASDSNNRIFMTILTDEQATPIAPVQHQLVPLRKQSQALQYSNYRGSRLSKPLASNNYLRRRASITKPRKNSYVEDTDYGGDSYARGAYSDDSSVFTEFTSVSQQRKRFRHTRRPVCSNRRLSPSFVSTSFSDASMAIDVIEVSFDLSQGRLGLKILINEEKHANYQQVCIIVAEVEPGTLAARDRRIKKNMIILEVNGFRLSDYGKDQAEGLLKQACSGHCIVTFVFAQTERERFNPHDDTVYPVDTSTWVKQTMFHTNLPNANLPAINEEYRFSPNPLKMVHNPCCLNAAGFPSSGVGSSVCSDSSYPLNANMTQMYQLQPKRFHVHQKLDIAVAMFTKGGLDLKHKINGKKTFASTEMVDWLRSNVHGLEESDKCQKFANKLVEDGLIALAIDKNKFVVKTECHYYFTDKLKKLVFKHGPLTQMNNQKPAMDDTLHIPQQKGFTAKLRRLFCTGRPQQPPQPQPQFRPPPHPLAAVRQLHDENSPPSFLQPPQYPPYRSSYAQNRNHQTYIP